MAIRSSWNLVSEYGLPSSLCEWSSISVFTLWQLKRGTTIKIMTLFKEGMSISTSDLVLIIAGVVISYYRPEDVRSFDHFCKVASIAWEWWATHVGMQANISSFYSEGAKPISRPHPHKFTSTTFCCMTKVVRLSYVCYYVTRLYPWFCKSKSVSDYTNLRWQLIQCNSRNMVSVSDIINLQ